MSKQTSRELKLLNELQTKFGYQIFMMRKEKERYEYVMNLSTGEGQTVRVFRLAVPERSELGKTLDNEKTRKARSKEMSFRWNDWLRHNVVGYAIGRAIWAAARISVSRGSLE